ATSRELDPVMRVQAGHATFTAETALSLLERPGAMKSHLHNVLFEPKTTRFWVANAGRDGTPAAEQPYHAFRLTDLLASRPDPSVPELPMRERPTRQAAD
ncbi:MAG: hypothetical protein KY476_23215, partial [Planctomycetes bacterium]|nr:hypothetical protein [Planctomycetota bacterium]